MIFPFGRRGFACMAALAVALGSCANCASGQQPDQYQKLQERIAVLESQIAQNPSPAPKTETPPSPPEPNKLALSATWSNGFVAQSEDKAFRIHIGGRAEFDNSWYTQSNN